MRPVGRTALYLLKSTHRAFPKIEYDFRADAVAAAFAFWASRHLLGHQQPVFAAISALICLAPGIPSQIRQGMGLIVGVTVGVVVGELALMIPTDLAAVRMASATFVAMMIAAAFSMAPVVPIHAGASAMLVLLMGPQVAGLARFLDVLIGASTGLIVALVFFRERLKF